MASPASQAERLRNPFGKLSYRADDGELVELQPPSGASASIREFECRYTITFSQFVKKAEAMFTVSYKPDAYKMTQILGTSGGLTFEFKVTGQPETQLSGAKQVQAQDFPLYKAYQSFKSVQIVFQADQFKPRCDSMVDAEAMLANLTTGNVSHSKGTSEERFCTKMREVSEAESLAQAEAAGFTSKFTIRTKRHGNTIAVAATPVDGDEAIQQSFGKDNLGKQFMIRPCKLFTQAALQIAKSPVEGVNAWILTIVEAIPDLDAPILGIISNKIHTDAEWNDFIGVDTDVEIAPIVVDILGQVTREGLVKFSELLDDISRQTLGFITPKVTSTGFPLRAMFLQDELYQEEQNKATGVPPKLPQWRGNASQINAVAKVFSHKMSLVWGPAATGKSEVMANAIVSGVMVAPGSKTLVLAPRNHPLDGLLLRCHTANKTLSRNNNAVLSAVRLFSEPMIQAQLAAGEDFKAKSHMYHIESLRQLKAEANEGRWKDYLAGRREQREIGSILEDSAQKKFRKALKELTRLVMDQVSNSALSWKVKVADPNDPTGQNKVDKTMTWGPRAVFFDEAACANPLELLLPCIKFGDTLKPYVVSKKGKEAWNVTWFKSLIDRKWPYTLLDTQYRTHSMLAAPVTKVIYEDKLTAFHKTAGYEAVNPAFRHLKTVVLPVTITTSTGQSWSVKEFTHFIDVKGAQEQGRGTSLINEQEIDCIVAFVRAFRVQKTPAHLIAVITGYRAQIAAIKARFALLDKAEKDVMWLAVRVISANTVQGEEFDFVLISLVKTLGGTGFLGERERANVIASRAKLAMYFLGNYDFWTGEAITGEQWLNKIFYAFRKQFTWQRWVVRTGGTSAAAIAAAPAPALPQPAKKQPPPTPPKPLSAPVPAPIPLPPRPLQPPPAPSDDAAIESVRDRLQTLASAGKMCGLKIENIDGELQRLEARMQELKADRAAQEEERAKIRVEEQEANEQLRSFYGV
ncbi:MAG: hypothetical protein Q9218_005590 [Villophora microphyllina]